MSRLRIGLIGTDREALRFYEANRYGMDVEVTAVCGPTQEETREFAARKGKMTLFTRPAELASSRDCDAVFVSGACTLTDFRKGEGQEKTGEDEDRYYHRQEIIAMMLEAGKHVICKAPLALTEQETEDLFGMARDRGDRLILIVDEFHCLRQLEDPDALLRPLDDHVPLELRE